MQLSAPFATGVRPGCFRPRARGATVVPAAQPLQHARRQRVRCLAASGDREAGHPIPLPLSLFTPYKNLPPDGQVIPPEEAACDVMERNCKTLAYVYESPCASCHGTGHARRSSSGSRSRGARGSSGGRGSLHVCLVCTGMGHVRRTTSRTVVVVPDGPAATLARTQRLPGEPTAQLAAPEPQHHHHHHHSSLLRKALKLGQQLVGKTQEQEQDAAADGANTPPVSHNTASKDAPQNNIVSSAGLGAAAKKQQQQAAASTAGPA